MIIRKTKEEDMKKTGLIVVLFLLVTAAAIAADSYDKEFQAGLKYYNSRNYTAAVKKFTEYLKQKPDPAAYYLTGYSLYKLHKFNEAEEYFSQAYLIDPEFSLEKAGLMRKDTQ
jgi:TolA-binding protein